jgi:hypothetical protein
LCVFDESINKLAGNGHDAEQFRKFLRSSGVYAGGHGTAGTVQETVAISRGGTIVSKPRCRRLNLDKIDLLVEGAVGMGDVTPAEDWLFPIELIKAATKRG